MTTTLTVYKILNLSQATYISQYVDFNKYKHLAYVSKKHAEAYLNAFTNITRNKEHYEIIEEELTDNELDNVYVIRNYYGV